MEPVEPELASSSRGQRVFKADQPLASPSPKKKRKRTKEPSPEAELWAVKRIVEQKNKAGKLYYLIDWEDHPHTGESYKKSWEPAENVTRDAVDEWNLTKKTKRKREVKRRRREIEQASGSTAQPSSIDPDSQPRRPASAASRKHTRHWPLREPREAGTPDTIRFSPALQQLYLGSDRGKEIKDSYEDDERTSERVRPRVELPLPGNSFDRDAYTNFLESSQSLQPEPSSHPHSSTESQFKTPRKSLRKAFIWDEDTPVAIPDSQDVLGSLSYIPTEFSSSTNPDKISDSSSAIPPNSVLPFSGISQLFPSSQIRHSEPPYTSSINHSLESDQNSFSNHSLVSNIVDNRRWASLGSHSENRSPLSAQRVSPQQTQYTRYGQSDKVIEETQTAPSAEESPALQLSSLESIDREQPIHNLPHNLSQATNTNAKSRDSYDQLSSALSDTDLPQSVVDSNDKSLHSTSSLQHAFIEAPDSQTLPTATPHSKSIVQTERSPSSCEATWQAAQVVSYSASTPSEFLSVQLAEDFDAIQESNSILSPNRSQLLQIDIEAASGSQADHSNYSPYPEILPSIEQSEEINTTRPVLHHSILFVNRDMEKDMENDIINTLLQSRGKVAAALAEKRATSSYTPTPPPPQQPPTLVNQMIPSQVEVADVPRFVPQTASPPNASFELEPEDLEFFDDVLQKRSQVLSSGPDEYIVPLPMVGIVRSVISTDIKNNNGNIRRFLNNTIIEPELLHDIESLINRMKLACSHQWLIEEESATQEQMSDVWVAKFSTNCSTKCIFVDEFLGQLRTTNAHIAILIQSGKLMQIMEAILRYRNLQYTRVDLPKPAPHGESPLKISLIPTDYNLTNVAVLPASLVIAFDSSFDQQRPLGALRASNLQNLAPLIHLTVCFSVEHLELCIDRDQNEMDRLVSFLIYTKQLEERAGVLPEHYVGPDEAGQAVAKFLLADANRLWPLRPLPYIEELDFEIESSQKVMDSTHRSGSTTQSQNISSRATSPRVGSKRYLMTDSESDSTKRPRFSPANGEKHYDREEIESELMSSSLNGKDTNDDGKGQDMLSSMIKRVKLLELELLAKEASEQALQEEKRKVEAQCADLELSNQRIQPKYQEALNDRGEAQHMMNLALARERSAQLKAERLTEDLAKLREAKAVVDSGLINANEALANSTVPGVAEMQKMKNDLAAATEKNASLQKRLENLQGTLSYVQESHQTASNAASSAMNEVAELQEENTKLKRKASDTVFEVHKINVHSSTVELLTRIDELAVQKAEVERQLERKSDELKSVLNGRRSTRGTSVPRSPRMNNTMNPLNRVIGNNSRGNSPTPGDVLGPNRNTFGDILIYPSSGQPVTGRWAPHLT